MQTYTVAAYRGQDEDRTPVYRFLGHGLTEEKALRRIRLSARIWPHLAKAKAYGEELGEIDKISIDIKTQ